MTRRAALLLAAIALAFTAGRVSATSRPQAQPVPSWTPVELPSEAPLSGMLRHPALVVPDGGRSEEGGASPSMPAAPSVEPEATDSAVSRAMPAPSPRRTAAPTTGWHTATASWYGAELYGNRTACGQTYTSATWGVAHRSLPCGTKVQIRYAGRTVTVPVVDRGPYIAGRVWDLTAATAKALRFDGVHAVDWRLAS